MLLPQTLQALERLIPGHTRHQYLLNKNVGAFLTFYKTMILCLNKFGKTTQDMTLLTIHDTLRIKSLGSHMS